ncbi:Predicted Zn-dependent peptidase [Reichenbachiella faecimaris]|uniref:Predicted Zn-dependent peptidase n=1 Tax=Reichenbachiella faecimaris TaxID=692418 RepID=A0A1W2GAU3_REIFA|nr:pitrilysin family protein [Reichenbachiella faecimaris]SMD33799.1 Predicted Zn-dependent peptidase [Reichenbachiella faecimaris]
MKYEKFTLDNGLQVVVHEDHSTKVAVLNVLYNVGSRDEDENKTGFAHLFEHLMFGGSANIPSYDEPLQKVGGENNAFTTPDYTNYYISIPSNNLETAFWLESDRMLSLAFDPQSLEVQRKVVIEEFKQRYLDQPYGDAWLNMKPMVYKIHPYRWNTIGKEISHIEDATMDDVKAFFKKFYIPNNAILVVAGDVSLDQVKSLTKKWFAPIPAGEPYVRDLPQEPKQVEERNKTIQRDVPMNAFYRAYHMPDRLDEKYHTIDLLSDVLGRGKSSRLYTKLVKEMKLLNSIGASITGSIESGLLVISGKLKDKVSFDEVDKVVDGEIEALLKDGLTPEELDKVKMQAESSHVFSEVELLNRAMSLAYYTLLGNTELVNEETKAINEVSADAILKEAKKMLNKTNCSTLYYQKKEA